MTDLVDGWAKCGPHEISKLTDRIRARRQRQVIGRAALVVVSASVLLAIWLYPKPDQGPDFAGISCERVMDLSDAYIKRQLPPELQDQMRRHIALCPNCRGMFEDMPQTSHMHAHPPHPHLALTPTIAKRLPSQP